MLKLNNANFLVICTQIAIRCYRFTSKHIYVGISVNKSQLLNRYKTNSTVTPSIARAVLLQKGWILIRKQPSKKYSRRKFLLSGKEKQKVFSLLLHGISESSLVGRSGPRLEKWVFFSFLACYEQLENERWAKWKSKVLPDRGFVCAFFSFSFFFSKGGNNECRAAEVCSGSVRKSGAGYLKDRYFYYMLLSGKKHKQENHFLRLKTCKIRTHLSV